MHWFIHLQCSCWPQIVYVGSDLVYLKHVHLFVHTTPYTGGVHGVPKSAEILILAKFCTFWYWLTPLIRISMNKKIQNMLQINQITYYINNLGPATALKVNKSMHFPFYGIFLYIPYIISAIWDLAHGSFEKIATRLLVRRCTI